MTLINKIKNLSKKEILFVNHGWWKRNRKIFISMFVLTLVYKMLVFFVANLLLGLTVKQVFDVGIMNFWLHWDAGAYFEIALNGYTKDITAFYPLYPIMINFFNNFMSIDWSATLINFLALWWALVGLWKLSVLDNNKNATWRTIFYLLLFPTAVFLTAFYSESLFLCLAIWTTYFARQRRWSAVFIFGLLAGLARIEGVALIGLLLWEYFSSIKFNFKQIKWPLISALSPLVGLSLYAVFLWIKFGDGLLFIRIQANWYKKPSWPWQTFIDYGRGVFDFSLIHSNFGYYLFIAFDFWMTVIAIILSLFLMKKIRVSYGIYCLIATLLTSFTGTLGSNGRRAILLFPLLILLGKWGKNQIINFFIIMLGAMFFFLFLYRYIMGSWAG